MFLAAHTRSMRRQHETVLALTGEIGARIASLCERPERAEAYQVTLQLAELGGLLRVHLAREDDLLYPAMMASSDRTLAATARAFAGEMNQISPVLESYLARWSTPDAILGNPAHFSDESDALFAALGDRIARENGQLYPLVESLDGSIAPAA